MKFIKNSKTSYFLQFVAFSFYLWVLCNVSLYCSFTSALDPQGPLSLSMSGAGRAIYKGAEYHLLNPASLVHLPGFQAAGFYVFETESKKPYYGISMMENRQIPLALSYIKERQSGEQYLSISTAAFILPGWSLGLSLSRWETKQDTNWNIQAGFFIKPQQSPFSIGATWDHLLPVEGAFEGRRQWGLGLAYVLYKWLHLRADTIYNQKEEWKVAGGPEIIIANFLILRFGSGWHLADKTFLFSGGLGLETKNISLDYGLSQDKEKKEWLHSLNIRGYF